jgi:hypothetical protein
MVHDLSHSPTTFSIRRIELRDAQTRNGTPQFLWRGRDILNRGGPLLWSIGGNPGEFSNRVSIIHLLSMPARSKNVRISRSGLPSPGATRHPLPLGEGPPDKFAIANLFIATIHYALTDNS